MESGTKRSRPRMGTTRLDATFKHSQPPPNQMLRDSRFRLTTDDTTRSSLGLLHSSDVPWNESWDDNKENDVSDVTEFPSRYFRPHAPAAEVEEASVVDGLLGATCSSLGFRESSSSFCRGPVSARSTSMSHEDEDDDDGDDETEFKAASASFIDREEKDFDRHNGAELVSGPAANDVTATEEEAAATLSKSQYFLLCTSSIGTLDKEVAAADINRPNFGLGTVRSPTRRPCKVLVSRNTTTTAAEESSLAQFLPSFIETSPEKTFKKPFPVRHSSPVKEATKRIAAAAPKVRRSSPLKGDPANGGQETSSSSSGFTFPILSDEQAMVWLGVEPGHSREQFVTLKNTWSREVTVFLVVRESKDFRLKRSTTIKMPPNSTHHVFVTFEPAAAATAAAEGWTSGKLVIKPKDLGVGRTLKATIRLHGFRGVSKLRFGDDGGPVKTVLNVGSVPNDVCKVHRFFVFNDGSAPGFVRFDWNSAPALRVEPRVFVVEAGARRDVELRVDPEQFTGGQSIGLLQVTSGPESARQVLGTVEEESRSLLPDCFRPPPALSCSRNTLNLCEEATDRTEVEVVGRKTDPSDFNVLTYEDTLSETRLEVTAAMAVAPPSTKPPLPQQGKKGDVRFDAPNLIFPPVRPNKSVVAKITVKNPKAEPVVLLASPLDPPFFNNHPKLEVKGKYFRRLPLIYAPTSVGKHETAFRMKSQDGSLVLTANLKGSTY